MNPQERTDAIYYLLMKFEHAHGWEIPERRELAKFLAEHVKPDGLERPKAKSEKERIRDP